ncbi:MAG: hypothetical protein GC154_16845 [bacterium]|nr:hypothetical protein [bacterium]
MKNKNRMICCFGVLIAAMLTQSVLAGTPTRVLVRVLAHDAKLIGTGMGGVHVTIREARNGAILSEGDHVGGTGDTNKIIKEPLVRGENRFTGDSDAGFRATLDLERPTVVEISAEGPMAYPQAMQRASKTVLLIPGRDVTGEGVVLELHGFIVDIMAPESVDAVKAGEPFSVTASVRMLCGCPTQPEGLWDSDRYTIETLLLRDGKPAGGGAMKFSGRTNVFTGEFKAPAEGGVIELLVIASDAERANFGMDSMTLHVNQ